MKQYIKKVLWIIPFVFSLNLYSQAITYKFTASVSAGSYGDGSDIANWVDPNTGDNPGDFIQVNDVFDVDGKNVDLDGMTLGSVTILNNNSSTSSTITNSGTVNCSGNVKWGTTGLTLDFNTAGTTFNFTNSSGNQYIPSGNYRNLVFSGRSKILDEILSVNGNFTFNLNNTSRTVTISKQLTLGANVSFTCSLAYTFILTGTSSIVDNRSNKLFPHKWKFNNDILDIPEGTYGSLLLDPDNSSAQDGVFTLLGDVVVNGTCSTQTTLEDANQNPIPVRISLNGKNLTLTNLLLDYTATLGTPYGNLLIGDPRSSLSLKDFSGTLLFDQSTEDKRTLKNLTLTSTSAKTTNLGDWLNISAGTSSSGFGVLSVGSNCTLNTNGKLTLKSNQYGSAMIGTIAGTLQNTSGNNTGTLLVENFIGSSGRGRQYRFLSAPVSGGVFLQWRDSLITVSGNPRTGRGTHITGKQAGSAANDFDESTTNHPSAFIWDETKAGSITGISTTLGATEDPGWSRLSQANSNTIENGKGYRVLIRGDRTISLTSAGSNFTPNETTLQTRGGYVAGPVTVPITNSGSNTNNGINLIGNPYACAVDWQAVYNASSNVDASYVLYNPTSKTWQAYNAASTTPSIYRYISPGQGFLVYTSNPTSSGGGSVVFPVSSKITSDAGSRTFTEIKTNHLITHLRKDTTAADMNIIYFLSGATNYYDIYDAGHIQNEYVNLSSVDSTNTLYNINCLDSLSGQRIVPMSVYGTPKGTYTMAFDDVNTFRNHDVYLVDNFLNKTTKVDDMTQYTVEITEDKFSYAEGRFYINFEPKATSSIVSINKTENFTISPNPVKDIINITTQKSIVGDIEYDIFNINGQLISKGSMSEGDYKINSSEFSKGIYFITLKSVSETQTIKFIK